MMKIKIKKCIHFVYKIISQVSTLSLLIIFINFPSFCQKYLSLEECIKIAQTNNIDVKKSILNEEETILDYKYAKQQLYPSLNANSNLAFNVGRGIDPITNSYLSKSFLAQGINLNSTITVYDGNSINYNKEITQLNLKVKRYETEQLRKEIALNVIDIYLTILFNKESLKNSILLLKSTENQLAKMKHFVDLGLKLKSEYSQLEAQLFEEKEKIISIEGEIEMNFLDLKNILMINDDVQLEIKYPKIEPTNPSRQIIFNKIDISNFSVQNNRNYLKYNFIEQTAKIQGKIAKAMCFPTIKIGSSISTNFSNKTQQITGYEDTLTNQLMIIDEIPKIVGIPTLIPLVKNQSYFNQIKNNWGMGLWIQINIPIYNNYKAKTQIQKAKINEELIKLAKEKLKQEITSKTLKAYSEVNLAIQKYYAAEKSYAAQNEVFNVSNQLFESGKISIYDFQNAKSDFEKSQIRFLISKYQLIFKTTILDFYIGKEIKFEYE